MKLIIFIINYGLFNQKKKKKTKPGHFVICNLSFFSVVSINRIFFFVVVSIRVI